MWRPVQQVIRAQGKSGVEPYHVTWMMVPDLDIPLANSVRWEVSFIHPWRGVRSMRTLIHGSMGLKHRCTMIHGTDHLVEVGNMYKCDHDVESTQEGCLPECCSDMRWPGLFDEVRRASWRIYLSICK
jgi:hypothetical protein